jgi:hypothetical protein
MVAAWARFDDDVGGYRKILNGLKRSDVQINEDGSHSRYVLRLSTAIVALVNGDENPHTFLVIAQQSLPVFVQGTFEVSSDTQTWVPIIKDLKRYWLRSRAISVEQSAQKAFAVCAVPVVVRYITR